MKCSIFQGFAGQFFQFGREISEHPLFHYSDAQYPQSSPKLKQKLKKDHVFETFYRHSLKFEPLLLFILGPSSKFYCIFQFGME